MATREQPGLDPTTTPRLPARYVPVRLLAQGATATVWCAEDRWLGRRVAVKLLAEPYASDPAAVRRFLCEARAVARLSTHPHVVTIFDVGTTVAEHPGTPGRPFLVMAHVPGGTVADALRLGACEPADAVRWVHQAAQALDFAHAHGIVHRDVKPANLLLDGRRDLHMADFGIAQTAGQETLSRQRQVLGTASYLPPERALGRPATVASDLYSLAVVAFELLTGDLPFTGANVVELARRHLEAERPRASERNPALPRAVDAVLARGLAREPEDRYASAGAFAHALREAVAPLPVPARPDATAPVPRAIASTPRERPLRGPGRRASLAALLVVLFAVVILAAGAMGGGGTPVPAPARAAGSAVPAQSLGQAADARAGLLRTSDLVPAPPVAARTTVTRPASVPVLHPTPARPSARPAARRLPRHARRPVARRAGRRRQGWRLSPHGPRPAPGIRLRSRPGRGGR